jgi:proteasome lid subunit RPN8/RPN11
VRPLRLSRTLLDAMGRHARATYPDECCGFLIARPDSPEVLEPRVVVDALPAANEFAGERRRRFLLRPEELRAVERRHEGTGQVVAGFYHSHPDHPARPSLFDQEHAWPWYSYLVLGVTSAGVGETRAFELDPDSAEFREVLLTVEGPADPRGTLTVRLPRAY